MTITKGHPSLRALLSPIINHDIEVQIENDRSYSTSLPNPISNCKTVRTPFLKQLSSPHVHTKGTWPTTQVVCQTSLTLVTRHHEELSQMPTKRTKRRLLCSLAFSTSLRATNIMSEQLRPRRNPHWESGSTDSAIH